MFRYIFIFLFTIYSCNQPGVRKQTVDKVNETDTIIDVKKYMVSVRYNITIQDTPLLLETSSLLINDSLYQTEEYKKLRSTALRDSLLNFANHIDESDIELKHFDFSKDTLLCEVIFPTIEGRFYFGQVLSDSSNNVYVKRNNFIWVETHNNRPAYNKLQFKLLMPANFKLNRLYYRWD